MTVRKATNKVHNKKLRRRREGLLTKAYEYGELDGVELTLFIRYPKRGEFYYYTSKEGLPWLRDVEEKASLVSHPLPSPLSNRNRWPIPRRRESAPKT